MIRVLRVSLAVLAALPSLLADTISVNVPGTAGPWCGVLNGGFQYGVGDNGAPVVVNAASGIAFAAGDTLTVRYLSGEIDTWVGTLPYVDANGYPDRETNFYPPGASNGVYPAYYMDPEIPVYEGELVGTFANSGVIVGTPFGLGDGPATLTIPTGANELLLGVDDNYYSGNGGSFNVSIYVPATATRADAANVPEAENWELTAIGLVFVLFALARRPKRQRSSCPFGGAQPGPLGFQGTARNGGG